MSGSQPNLARLKKPSREAHRAPKRVRKASRKTRGPLVSRVLISCWVVLSVGYVIALYEVIADITAVPEYAWPLLAGMGVFAVVWGGWLRGHDRFWRTFEHELTHVIFALLFLQRVKHFRASAEKGGSIHHHGRRHNFLISLSPYFFPTVTVIPLVLLFLVTAGVRPYIEFLVGATLMYHLITTVEEARPYQTDLTQHGLAFSYTFIVLMNLVCVGLVLAMTVFDAGTGWEYLVRGVEVLYRLVV